MQSFIEKKSKMHAMNAKSTLQSRRGFTLVELMIVVLLTAIAVIAIYRGYTAFSHSVDVQEQIIEMQQNLRIGMYWLEKDLRRAGMNEEDDEIAGFRLDRNNDGPGPSSLSFTMDLGGTDAAVDDEDTSDGFEPGDGGLTDVGEWLTYKLVPVAGTTFFNLVKTDENNVNPDVPVDMTLITNVDALDFVYLDEAGDDIDPDATPDDPADGRSFLDAAADMNNIRSIQVAMVVRTTNEDLRYTNTEEYRNLQGSLIYQGPGDHFRRRLSVKQFKVRNAGL
jgi:prepilin-type N-terminal cleavage/methylation domain-containing protein